MNLLRSYKNLPKQFKSSFVILISSFITSAMSLLTTPIFTRLMSVEEYGLVTQYNSWLGIITVIATFSLSAGVFQVAMSEFSEDRDRFTFSALCLSNFVTILLFAFVFIFLFTFVDLFQLPVSLIVFMFIYLLFYPAMDMWLSRQRYEYSYVKVAVISIGSSLVSQIIAIILVVCVKGLNLGVVKVWASGVAMILTSIGLYISIAAKAKFRPSFKYVKFAFVFNAPLLIHYLAQYALRSTDKIMITRFLGEGATGIYGLGSTVANIALLAWTALSASITPYIYDHMKDKDYGKINSAVVGVEIFFALCCVFVSVIGPEIIYVLGSQKYMEGIQLIPPIAASCLLTAIYGFYSLIAFYYHKRISTAIMTIIAAAINIVLNYFLIPKFGYVAAAYTTEIAYLIYTILHYFNYRLIVKKDRIYKDGIIFLIAGAATGICLIMGFLYDYWFVRYAIILVGLILCIIFRKKIINFFKSILKGKNSNAVAESATNISSEESDALEAENDSITETIEATEKGDDNDRD